MLDTSIVYGYNSFPVNESELRTLLKQVLAGVVGGMGLPGEEEAGKVLLSLAAEQAREEERERLLVVLPPWTREAAFLQSQGFHWVPSKQYLERRLGSYLWKEVMTSEWLADHWYYTLGDSDLV